MKNLTLVLASFFASASIASAKTIPNDVYNRGLATAGAYLGIKPDSATTMGFYSCQFETDPSVEQQGAWSVTCSTTTRIDATSFTLCTGRAIVNAAGDKVLNQIVTQQSRS